MENNTLQNLSIIQTNNLNNVDGYSSISQNNLSNNSVISSNTLNRGGFVSNSLSSNSSIQNNTLNNSSYNSNNLSNDSQISNITTSGIDGFYDNTLQNNSIWAFSNTVTQNISNINSLGGNFNGDISAATYIYQTYPRTMTLTNVGDLAIGFVNIPNVNYVIYTS